MDAKQLRQCREKLVELRDTIQNQPINLAAIQQEKVAEDFEKAAQIIDQTITTQLLNRQALYLRQIKNAISKLDTGDYGFCEECGDNIGFKRLLVRPTALHCVTCKSIQERQEREQNRFGVGITAFDNDD